MRHNKTPIPCTRGSYLPQNERQEAFPPGPKVLLVVGPKKNGKTTLIEKLIPELSARDYRVGTVKHHHAHSPLQMDHEGKDSWRHRKAGAKAVAVVSPSEVAVVQNTNELISLNEAIGLLRGVDIVLAEGFSWESKPKIEVRRTLQEDISSKDNQLLAFVSPEKHHRGIPCFTPDEIKPLADLIEEQILGRHTSIKQ